MPQELSTTAGSSMKATIRIGAKKLGRSNGKQFSGTTDSHPLRIAAFPRRTE